MHFVSRLLQNRAVHLIGQKPYVYITALGTMVHELGHAFFCVIFAHKIVQVQWFKPGDDGVLGFVKHSYNARNPWAILGNFFIGTGPIWFGVTALWVLGTWGTGMGNSHLAGLIPDPTFFENMHGTHWLTMISNLAQGLWQMLRHLDWQDWKLYVFAYLFLSIGSHITLSPPDIRSSLSGIILIIAIWYLVNLVALWANASIQTFIDKLVPYGHLVTFALVLTMLATLATAILLALIGSCKR
jgi:hypothetical protein